MVKTYSQLVKLETHLDRFNYLRCNGMVASETFGSQRYLNQMLYRCPEWKSVRNKVIVRDNGNDMGVDGYAIGGIIIVHHINPIRPEDILNRSPEVFDMENLISVSPTTHNAIHYGDDNLLIQDYKPRSRNDTCPWRNK